jgi:hypothetical protein
MQVDGCQQHETLILAEAAIPAAQDVVHNLHHPGGVIDTVVGVVVMGRGLDDIRRLIANLSNIRFAPVVVKRQIDGEFQLLCHHSVRPSPWLFVSAPHASCSGNVITTSRRSGLAVC